MNEQITIQDKNIAIAEMLGINQQSEEKFSYGRGDKPYFKDYYFYIPFLYIGRVSNLKFDTDANWQFEVIDWIENIKVNDNYCYEVKIWGTHCEIKINPQYLLAFDIDYPVNWQIGRNKKEAIFEALYQFSQYLKNSK